MERIPILRLGRYLLVTIQVDMHDRLALQLQDDLMSMIERTNARGVLIDISALEIVDSFIGRMISDISSMSRVLDARTVLTGMRPAVAITLVELGLTLQGVQTALDVERGMRLLRNAVRDADGHDDLHGSDHGSDHGSGHRSDDSSGHDADIAGLDEPYARARYVAPSAPPQEGVDADRQS